jgi:CDP-diacylglycerol--glycerol-3-phosphate 3-phosphatidyltransferase
MATSATEQSTGAAKAIENSGAVGRERFWNLPNSITMVRTAAVPILLLLLLPVCQRPTGARVIAWCFIIAALTDLLDGWLARRGQMVTHIGKLLDPLADKLIVTTALVVMLAIDWIPRWATWMVVVIIGRELAVTALRGMASADGQIMAAAPAGKVKAFVQNFAIGALLFHYPTLGLPAHEIGLTLLALATALTLVSGYAYFAAFFRGRGEGGSRGGDGT